MCVGAVDGTYIPIEIPPPAAEGNDFYDRHVSHLGKEVGTVRTKNCENCSRTCR